MNIASTTHNTVVRNFFAPGDTTLDVKDTSGFPSSGLLSIGDIEIVSYAGTTPMTFTGITRAQYGSNPRPAPIGDVVTGLTILGSAAVRDTGTANGNVPTIPLPAGPTGPKGDTGNTGPQGPTGLTGPAGSAGSTGPQGPQGVKGDTGLTGPQGVKGDTGLTGPQGPAGSQGPIGNTGAQGPIGNTGPAGSQGNTGPQGTNGTDGKTLRNGTGAPLNSLGVDGDFYIDPTAQLIYGPRSGGVWPAGVNYKGAQGIQGPIGNTGNTGAQGIQGNTGAQGIQGIQGPAGPSVGTSAFGYATGAGGTVIQGTSKATAVTLSKLCGTITMNAAALAAATIVTFTVTNTTVAATDLIPTQHDSGGTIGAYTITANTTAAGSFKITVRNNTAASLSEAIVIRFAVIKAVVA